MQLSDKNARAIANLELLIALRSDEKHRLETIIANEIESASAKSFARERLAELQGEDEADEKELGRLRAGD
jgi:hypothetical protein